MAYTHVAHDCLLGSDIIMSNNASASGHCVIEDHVIMGGFSALHQNVRVGEYAMVGGAAVITKDVCPYVVISGDIAKLFGLNLVGLRRAGFSRPDFQALEEAYKILFRGTLNTTQALDAIAALPELNPHVKHLLEFARASQRGIHK
jgi:UDP-N-acetylglucosamine acyltransferase